MLSLIEPRLDDDGQRLEPIEGAVQLLGPADDGALENLAGTRSTSEATLRSSGRATRPAAGPGLLLQYY